MSLLRVLASASGNRAMRVKEGIFIKIWMLRMIETNYNGKRGKGILAACK